MNKKHVINYQNKTGFMRLIFFFLFVFSITMAFSQSKRTISGFITNEQTGEKLIGATVYDTVSKMGAGTNEYGFFSLTIPAKDAFLRISYFGLKTKFVSCALGRKEINIELTGLQELEEVTASADGSKRSVESTNTGTIELQLDKIDRLPIILGEKDLFRVLQLLPGVKSGGEASSGLYVRGGGPDQNLILLDGVPVYNASHLFGFFSVFNSDALSGVTLIKGGFPARYAGRASSVLDMRMKEGNMKNYNVEGSVGFIASRILVEGPIIKDKTAFSFSARRTYLDLLARPFIRDGDGGYFFEDINAKIHHKINDKHHLFFSTYLGLDKAFALIRDEYTYDGEFHKTKDEVFLKWGNAIGAIRWNYKMGPKLFLNTTATYSNYKFNVGEASKDDITDSDGNKTTESFSVGYYSGIRDWALKSDFTYIPNPKHHIKFGIGDIYHTFSPGVVYLVADAASLSMDTSAGSDKQFSHEFNTYFEDDYKVTDRFKVNYGLNYAVFFASGKIYNSLQPRISANYLINDRSSIKLGLSRMTQFLHLLSNTGIGLPTDLWVPATKKIAPIQAYQASLAYNHELGKNFNLIVETYYKKMNNIIQYKEGANFISISEDWQNRVTTGQGWAYGGELFIEKKKGKFTGWIGYTLSWAERQFDELNLGKKFFYRYDRRHDLSVVLTYNFNEVWDMGVVFVYGTGNAVTIASQIYNSAPNLLGYPSSINYFGQLNGYRMPSYHRMDFGLNYKKDKRWGNSVLSFSVYNLYNRQNAFLLYTDYNTKGQLGLYQASLFPIIPSFSWKFKFDFEKIKRNKLESHQKSLNNE